MVNTDIMTILVLKEIRIDGHVLSVSISIKQSKTSFNNVW